MYDYTIITSDAALENLMTAWRQKGIHSVAMDFEGEFNLHVYGEHLCLIQLFDGHAFFLIDPFKVSVSALKDFLEAEDIEKIMFDCTSDAALVRKQYGIQLKNICDVRVMALALGFQGNLTGLLDAYVPGTVPVRDASESKKKNQMTNWMKRPLNPSQIVYALDDVAYLFTVRTALEKAVEEKEVGAIVAKNMPLAPLPKGPDRPGWEKLSGWKFFNRQQKAYVQSFFKARDSLARQHNVPAARILDKHTLVLLARTAPLSDSDLKELIEKNSPVSSQLLPLMREAQKATPRL